MRCSSHKEHEVAWHLGSRDAHELVAHADDTLRNHVADASGELRIILLVTHTGVGSRSVRQQQRGREEHLRNSFCKRHCGLGAAGCGVPHSMVHGGCLVRAGGGAAHGVKDDRHPCQLARVPGFGHPQALAGDGVGDGVGGFSSGAVRRNTVALSAARGSRALQVAERILCAGIARQRVPRGSTCSSHGIL